MRPHRDCATIIASPLAVLINEITTLAYVPVDWKLAELCPILKKDDALDKTNTDLCLYWTKYLKSAKVKEFNHQLLHRIFLCYLVFILVSVSERLQL